MPTESYDGTEAGERLEPGTILSGIYEILGLLGTGGMSRVYRARHVHLNVRRAIKIIRSDINNDSDPKEFLVREAQALIEINHDAVARCHELGFDRGRFYLVMELVEGESLESRMKAGPLDSAAVLTLWRRMAEGLAAVHAKGVVHRDVSPSNIMLPEGRPERAKLIDFGISSTAQMETMTKSAFTGKFAYASPEQFGQFGGKVGPKSDIFSLGLVLAEAASGSQAYRTPYELQLPPDLPNEFRGGILKLIEPDPSLRPDTASPDASGGSQPVRPGHWFDFINTMPPWAALGSLGALWLAGALAGRALNDFLANLLIRDPADTFLSRAVFQIHQSTAGAVFIALFLVAAGCLPVITFGAVGLRLVLKTMPWRRCLLTAGSWVGILAIPWIVITFLQVKEGDVSGSVTDNIVRLGRLLHADSDDDDAELLAWPFYICCAIGAEFVSRSLERRFDLVRPLWQSALRALFCVGIWLTASYVTADFFSETTFAVAIGCALAITGTHAVFTGLCESVEERATARQAPWMAFAGFSLIGGFVGSAIFNVADDETVSVLKATALVLASSVAIGLVAAVGIHRVLKETTWRDCFKTAAIWAIVCTAPWLAETIVRLTPTLKDFSRPVMLIAFLGSALVVEYLNRRIERSFAIVRPIGQSLLRTLLFAGACSVYLLNGDWESSMPFVWAAFALVCGHALSRCAKQMVALRLRSMTLASGDLGIPRPPGIDPVWRAVTLYGNFAVIIMAAVAWSADGSPFLSVMRLTTDLTCDWKLDGERKGQMEVGNTQTVSVAPGMHAIEAVTDDGKDEWHNNIELAALQDVPVTITLAVVRAQRESWQDRATGLTWTRKDNGSDVDWKAARDYCEGMRLSRSAWRLPTIAELATIHDPSLSSSFLRDDPQRAYKVNYHIKGDIVLTESSVWSSTALEDRGDRHWYFDFTVGYRNPYLGDDPWLKRALCVRSE